MNDWAATFEQAARGLSAAGLPARWYVVPEWAGYESLTGTRSDVHCLEARLGPTPRKPGHSTYAVVQAFDPRYPNLTLVTTVSRQDATGAPGFGMTLFDKAIDKAYSTVFLPYANAAFNGLDPAGMRKGQNVQIYQAGLLLEDVLPSLAYTWRLLDFRKDGQLAQVAVDFSETLIVLVANALAPVKPFLKGLHWLGRTDVLSPLLIPLENPRGRPFAVSSSTALDDGFVLAYRYLDEHYRRHGVPARRSEGAAA